MVLANADFQVLAEPYISLESGVSRLIPKQAIPQSIEPTSLETAVANVRKSLTENKRTLERAAEIRSKNEGDTTLGGFESYDDDQLLRTVDQLATVSSIHGEWSENVCEAVRMLEAIKEHRPAVWSRSAEELLGELRMNLDDLRWVEKTFYDWSNRVGEEFDRRHPDLPPLPFEPLDLGPMDSARLPSVL